MLHTQLQHLPHDTFKFYLKRRDKFFRDATTQASPSMLKHLSSSDRSVQVVKQIMGERVKGTRTHINSLMQDEFVLTYIIKTVSKFIL